MISSTNTNTGIFVLSACTVAIMSKNDIIAMNHLCYIMRDHFKSANQNAGRDCRKRLAGLVLLVLTAACTSVDQVGMMTLPTADPGSLLTKPLAYQTLGAVEGRACRYFAIGLIPWGNSTAGAALEKALASTGGNVLLNASVESDVFGFIPIYNVLSFTCTTVRGIAIKYESPDTVNEPHAAPPS